jgi:hypothetical protein
VTYQSQILNRKIRIRSVRTSRWKICRGGKSDSDEMNGQHFDQSQIGCLLIERKLRIRSNKVTPTMLLDHLRGSA